MSLTSQYKKCLQTKFKNRALFDEPMSLHTSFKIGGNADAYIYPKNIREIAELVKFVKKENIPFFIKGGGSNLLVKDKGIRGVTIDLQKYFNTISIAKKRAKTVNITAMAGVKIATLTSVALKYGLRGFEFAYGIPGTIGGAIYGNAGTGLGSVEKILNNVIIVDENGEIKKIEKKEMDFSYRKTSFKNYNSPIIVESSLSFSVGEPNEVKKNAGQIIKERKKKQPLTEYCAGCFFKNPEGEKSAGALIELAGLKGKILENAAISEKHANFIINRSNATARQILNLAELIRNRVKKKFSIELQLEVKIVGD